MNTVLIDNALPYNVCVLHSAGEVISVCLALGSSPLFM